MRRLVVSLVALLPLAGAFPACGPAPKQWSFESRAAAEKDPGAREALPAWLPASATSIRMVHDPGSGTTWLRFSLSRPAREALRSGLYAVPGDQAATLTVPSPPGADWWFATPSSAGADFYDGNGRDVPARAHVAFAQDGETAWAWVTK